MLTVEEAAKRMKVNPETVRRWLRAGRIQGVQVAPIRGRWRIPSRELTRLRTGERQD